MWSSDAMVPERVTFLQVRLHSDLDTAWASRAMAKQWEAHKLTVRAAYHVAPSLSSGDVSCRVQDAQARLTAIRFVLSDAYTSMSREERQALLHEGVSVTTTLSAYGTSSSLHSIPSTHSPQWRLCSTIRTTGFLPVVRMSSFDERSV